jgi:hypothetical protein
MLILNEKTDDEVALRVVLESELFGRDYFDDYETLDEMLVAVKNIVESSANQKDGIERTVAIAVVPKQHYGDPSGYGYGLGDDN